MSLRFLAHPVKFAQGAPVLRELCLHELAEYTVPAVAASGAQPLDGEHGRQRLPRSVVRSNECCGESSVVAKIRAEDRCIRAWARMARA